MANEKRIPEIVSRKEAKDAGLKYFFTGAVCQNGHLAERRVSSAVCVECARMNKRARPEPKDRVQKRQKAWHQTQKEMAKHDPTQALILAARNRAKTLQMRCWRKNNKERNLETQRRSAAKNREKRREAGRIRDRISGPLFREKNREKIRQYSREWKASNRDKVRVHSARVKAIRKGAEGSHTSADLAEIFKMQGGRCAYCRQKLDGAAQVDHIKPLARGGSNFRGNLQFLCRPCNMSKLAKDPLDFARSLGKLL